MEKICLFFINKNNIHFFSSLNIKDFLSSKKWPRRRKIVKTIIFTVKALHRVCIYIWLWKKRIKTEASSRECRRYPIFFHRHIYNLKCWLNFYFFFLIFDSFFLLLLLLIRCCLWARDIYIVGRVISRILVYFIFILY